MILTLIHYISASRRLDECEKTIIMLGGSEFHDRDIPMQVAAQRDMMKREVKYYGEKLRFWGYFGPAIILTLVFVVVMMTHFGVFK